MRLPPPLLRFVPVFFCGQGQFKDCSIVRWDEAESKGYVLA